MDQEQKNQIRDRDEDEINLMDYLKIILKRKWLILSVFLLAIISAGIFSFISPRIYEIDTLFGIGRIKEKVVESPTYMVEKIEGDVYGILVREKLGIPIQEYPEIKAENLEGTMLIRMTIESFDIQQAKGILSKINKIVLEEHQKEINIKKELIGKNIKTTEEKIKFVEGDIKRIESKIVFSGKEKENLEEQVRALEEVLIYKQTPGTQFALFNTRRRLTEKGREIEGLHSRIISLRIRIEDMDSVINLLKASLHDIELTKVLRVPIASEEPIRPRPLLNIVIAGILGLFMGTFLAFGKEWYIQSK